ncbi:MAG TPA: hypothetical protein VEM40_12490 [Nitrospirota bacterium]|nr:hypothetical protein [Nitrospirota bacterium]
MKRKFIIFIVLALILAIAGTAVYVLTNLNSIVKAAIEKYGSQATKTDVRVSAVKIKLRNGEGAVLGLKVANPAGFSFPFIITLDDIAVQIEPRSVKSRPIVIDNILISGPEVFYEMKENGTTNVDVMKQNLTPSGSPSEEQPQQSSRGKAIKLNVKKLVFEKGMVHVRIAKLVDKPYTVELPRLELTDIGKHGGATPSEIARLMATTLAEETAKAVARTQGKRLLRKGVEDLIDKYLSR